MWPQPRTPRISGSHQKLEEAAGPSPRASGDAPPCRHLRFRILASRLERAHFCWCEAPWFTVLCNGSTEANTPPSLSTPSREHVCSQGTLLSWALAWYGAAVQGGASQRQCAQ